MENTFGLAGLGHCNEVALLLRWPLSEVLLYNSFKHVNLLLMEPGSPSSNSVSLAKCYQINEIESCQYYQLIEAIHVISLYLKFSLDTT